MWFDKPLSSLLLPGSTLTLKEGVHKNVHHEIEMGVVIGMNGRDIKPENALKHIAAYFVGIDFTHRDVQCENKKVGADWAIAKGSNEFTAVSEYIHKSQVPDCGNVEIELLINGESR